MEVKLLSTVFAFLKCNQLDHVDVTVEAHFEFMYLEVKILPNCRNFAKKCLFNAT